MIRRGQLKTVAVLLTVLPAQTFAPSPVTVTRPGVMASASRHLSVCISIFVTLHFRLCCFIFCTVVIIIIIIIVRSALSADVS